MKTLTEIKKVRCFNRLVLFVVALGLITTFTACSNDDDSDIPVYSLKDVDGNYPGTMLTESDPPVNPQTNSPKEEQPEGATVTAEVKDNQVMIKKLPVDDLIKSIVDEETAGIIIENLDDINYNIPYTAAFNDDSKGSILLQLKPEPLEIKYTIYVTNNSEKDYNNVAYYRYGTKKDNPVKLSINTIVDYIDQKVPTEYTNVAKSSGGWYVSTDQQIKDLTTKKAYNDVKSRKNILLSDCNKTISIGETMATEPVEASKVMASSEDVDIKNYAEVVKVSNSVGRFYGGIVNSEWVNMTPGNLQVSSDTAIDESHELDDDGVEVVVVPSTGDNTIIYYILGITCLGIIVCGIVLIKKLVL